MKAAHRGIPLALKVLYLVWVLLWLSLYWSHYGLQNPLWMCDVAGIVILFGLWLESPLLLSSQAAGVLIVQIAWSADFLGALLSGNHLVGGTEYMFDASLPLWLRSISLFHMAMPPLLVWSLLRTGYHPAGWMLQTLMIWMLLPLTWLLSEPRLNINWLWRPFGVHQDQLPPAGVFALMMLAYPLVLFYPTHLVLRRLLRPVHDA